MTSIWKKLNLKDQVAIAVVNAPESFELEIAALEGVAVSRILTKAATTSFFIVFATKAAEVARAAKAVAKAKGDPIVWVAYPKGSSKRYACEFNRDTGWTPLGDAGFEGVRQVAIDEDWSALRFRHVENIRVMKRQTLGALSKEGKRRTAKKK